MSFKLFVYYCALCGAWAAFLGWGFGTAILPEGDFARALTYGLTLGLFVASALGLVDALWNLSSTHILRIGPRVLMTVVVGCAAGVVGAVLGQFLYEITGQDLLRVVGWTLTGLLIGASVGVYDALARLLQGENVAGAVRKIVNGVVGGGLGGLLGGGLSLVLGILLPKVLGEDKVLLSPSAIGFVALGLSIGLLIGLAQVILKEAWIRVEAGFRAGRELILSKPEITIGRAESCDIGLFGDAGAERTHARIMLQGNRYVLAEVGSSGTFLNGTRITEPVPLRSGDAIQVGNSILRFEERQRRAETR